MSEMTINDEVLSQAMAGWWSAMRDVIARERGYDTLVEDDALPVMPGWMDLPDHVREALRRHLCDAVHLSFMGFATPGRDHFVLECFDAWCEAADLKGRLESIRAQDPRKGGYWRHKVYGLMAAVLMQRAAEAGLVVHLGHVVLVLRRYQSPSERPISEQDVILWKREPTLNRERWFRQLREMLASTNGNSAHNGHITHSAQNAHNGHMAHNEHIAERRAD